MAETTAVLYVRIPVELRAELQRVARETGLTLATVACEVLSRGLGQSEVRGIAERIDKSLRGGAGG